MRILWPHNFNPNIENSGVFMNVLASGLCNFGVNIELYYLGNLRSVKNLLRARTLVANIANKFDLVHGQFGSACAVATASANGVPKILSLRGSDWYWYKESWNLLVLHSFLATAMTRKVLKKFDLIITMSHRMRREVESSFPNVSVVSIPDPIDLQHFYPIDKHVARTKLGFPNDTDKWILFITVNPANPIKRFELAREAVDLAKQRMKGIKLKIATGISHENMPILINACDLVLCTSVYEGWPNVIKEGLACNVPFVATDVSDLSIIANQEPSCRVCPPDPEVLAQNICDVLSTAGNEDLRRHVIEMDVPIVSRKILNVYECLLSRQ